jgi:hypothetical protein
MHIGRLPETGEQAHGFAVDALLGIIEQPAVEADREACKALRIGGE